MRWWVGEPVEHVAPRGPPWPGVREMQDEAAPREAERAGRWISLRRTVAVVARARSVPVRTPEARVRLNAIPPAPARRRWR